MIDNTTNDQEQTDTFGEDTYTAAGTLENSSREYYFNSKCHCSNQNPQKDERSVRTLTGFHCYENRGH